MTPRPHPNRAARALRAASLALACLAAPAAAQSTASGTASGTTSSTAPVAAHVAAPTAAPRPMTWLDVQRMRQLATPAASPDGRWVLYTLSTPDWKEARRQSDVYLVSAQQGVATTRRLTFTPDKNEILPTWSRDGKWFVFLSDRDARAEGSTGAAGAGGGAAQPRPVAAPNLPAGGAFAGSVGGAGYQLYLMSPDGGEARRITDARDGVTTFAFSRDGRWLAYRSGKAGEEQLWLLPAGTLAGALAAGDSLPKPAQLTRQSAGVGLWRWAPDAARIYFVSADTADPDERLRIERRFDVRIRNMETPASGLWAADVDADRGTARRVTRLTSDTSYSVGTFTVSDDGKWIGFHGLSTNRYERNILEQLDNADLYLLRVATGDVERLTRNTDIPEGEIAFSPDSRWLAFSAPDDFRFMHDERVWLRRVDDRGATPRKLGAAFDGDVTVGAWSTDGATILFATGVRATEQLMALDVATGAVRQLTSDPAALRLDQDPETKRLFVTYSDPRTPPTLYTVADARALATRPAWVRLTDANPWTRDLALGDEKEISWTSKDGRTVGGILVTPVGWTPGTRVPLIVSIHGGPAAADVLSFNGGYGAQVYAGAGYAVLMPNYRNSTNYGERHKIESQGDYFTKGYEDIMTGVDRLIADGVVDSTRMGVLGWSAGGHWSNWILTHTDRFKAISTGAGVFNWISMYGESDTQRVRQWYLGDRLWYDDMEHWWRQSPAAYIKNAKTPTMIHVVDGDPRVPRPQSEELHMALKRLGVPTEFWVYPGNSHGIPDPRNQLLKSTAEMAWMDYWVRGSGRKFAWRDVLKTVEDSTAKMTTTSSR